MSESSGNSENIFCLCPKIASRSTSWKSSNPVRRFVGCGNYPNDGQCKFFKWIDPPMCERSKQTIPGLLKRLNENQLVNSKNEDLEIENRVLKLEIKRLKEKNMKLKDKKMKFMQSVYKMVILLVIGHVAVLYLLK